MRNTRKERDKCDAFRHAAILIFITTLIFQSCKSRSSHTTENLIKIPEEAAAPNSVSYRNKSRYLLFAFTTTLLYSLIYISSLNDGDLVSNRQLTLVPPIPISVSVTTFLYCVSAIIFIIHTYFLIQLRPIRLASLDLSLNALDQKDGLWFFDGIIQSYLNRGWFRSLRADTDKVAGYILIWILPQVAIAESFYVHSAVSSVVTSVYYSFMLFSEWFITFIWAWSSQSNFILKSMFSALSLQGLYFTIGTAVLTADTPEIFCQIPPEGLPFVNRPGLTQFAVDITCKALGKPNVIAQFLIDHPVRFTKSYDNGSAFFSIGLTPTARTAQFAYRRLSRYSNDIGVVDGPNSHLEGPKLTNVTLRDAQFYESYMRRANIQSADLVGMKAISTDLGEASIVNTNMSLSIFTSANLADTAFYGDLLVGASFPRVSANRMQIESSLLVDTDFGNAELHCALFRNNPVLGRTNFAYADLTDAVFVNNDFSAADFTGANLTGACSFAGRFPSDLQVSECKGEVIFHLCPNISKELFPASDLSHFRRDNQPR